MRVHRYPVIGQGAVELLDNEHTLPEPPDEQPETLGVALAKVTPTLVVVGIATGAAFAIGSALVAWALRLPRRR